MYGVRLDPKALRFGIRYLLELLGLGTSQGQGLGLTGFHG